MSLTTMTPMNSLIRIVVGDYMEGRATALLSRQDQVPQVVAVATLPPLLHHQHQVAIPYIRTFSVAEGVS